MKTTDEPAPPPDPQQVHRHREEILAVFGHWGEPGETVEKSSHVLSTTVRRGIGSIQVVQSTEGEPVVWLVDLLIRNTRIASALGDTLADARTEAVRQTRSLGRFLACADSHPLDVTAGDLSRYHLPRESKTPRLPAPVGDCGIK
jgi:hypothetical protein